MPLSALLLVALQGSLSADLADRFQVPAGVRVTLWAESPDLYNPTAIDVDAKGRVWVAEAVNYRAWGTRNPGLRHPAGDRIVVLEDTDGDGACDKATVFAQDEDLVAPLGVSVVGDEVLVACSPHVFAYKDTDGDLVADERRVFLTGFGGHDHDHGVHSFTPGPDGALYAAVGNAGPHDVTDAAGFRLRSGSAYTGGSPHNSVNHAGLVSDDGRVWTGGLMLRVERDGTGLTVLADNFRNPYELAVDSFGDLFTADNDDDGNACCRTTWVLEGADYGFFSTDGTRSWQADRRPGQDVWEAHWHQADPGVVPAGTRNGAGGPTGACVYEVTELDDPMAAFHGAVLNADAGAGVVYAHLPRRPRSGLELEKTVLIGRTTESGRERGDGRGSWFRPSDVAVAPDGSILVADWYDPGVGGHAAGDREAYGRILRVAPDGDGAPGGALGSVSLADADLVQALASPNLHARTEAAARLAHAGEERFEALRVSVGHPNLRVAARALWPLARMGRRGAEFVEQVTYHPSSAMRIAALRALRRAGQDVLPVAARFASSPEPAPRLAAALTLRDEPWERAGPALLALASRYEGGDRPYLEALGIGAEGKERELYDQLQALTNGGLFANERLAEIAWRLHPPAAATDFAHHAMDASTPLETRRLALEALAFMPTREAANAVLDLALAGPHDTRADAGWWVRHRAANDWRGFGLEASLPARDLAGSVLRWASGVVTEGTVPVDVDLAGATTLWLVVTDGGDGESCDWADWLEPRLVTAEGELDLTALAWSEGRAGWGSLNVGKNCNGGPLRVGETAFERGLGTHAHSEVAWRLPDGALRLSATAGVDHGGTSQGCGTSVEFQVYTDAPEDRSALEALRAAVLDETRPEAARAEAARALAIEPEGGLFLVRLAEQDSLAPELRVAAASAIFRNPDLGVRALASAHFERPGAAGTPLPPIADLARLEGDPARGARVYFGEEARCSTCHVFDGRGGDVGPELTRVREKYAKEALLDAILNPSAGISVGYETWLVETTDGVLYSGFVLADGDDLLIKDTQGIRHVIPADEVAARQRQELSTMPDGIALGLDSQAVADLAAFLLHDRSRAPVFGAPIALFDGESLAGWTHHLSDPAADPEDVWSVVDGVLRCEGRPAGYIRTQTDHESYELTLEWRFDPARGPGNSGVLLRLVGADKVWPKSIEAQLHAGDAGDIWNIDAVGMQVDPTRTSGRRTRKLAPSAEKPLGEWNRYRILLDGGELTLEVNGVVQNTARWCDVVPGKIGLQSEGAYIEFRDIVLRPILN